MEALTGDATAAEVLRVQLEELGIPNEHDPAEAHGENEDDFRLTISIYQQQLQEQESVRFDRLVARDFAMGSEALGNLEDEAGGTSQSSTTDIEDPVEESDEHAISGNTLSLALTPEVKSADLTSSGTARSLSQSFAAATADNSEADTPERLEEGQIMTSNIVTGPFESTGIATISAFSSSKSNDYSDLGSDGEKEVSTDEHDSIENTVCIACGDGDVEAPLVKLACEHHFCEGCLAAYCEHSFKLTSAFPPDCCELPITPAIIQDHVSEVISQRFEEMQDAIARAQLKLCAAPTCKEVLSDYQIDGDKGHCAVCNEDTCVKCSLLWHPGKPCATDENAEKTNGTSKEK